MIMDAIYNVINDIYKPPSVEERIKQNVGQSMVMWIIGPGDKAADEIATRKGLRGKKLETFVMTYFQYKARQVQQSSRNPVGLINGVPVLLSEEEVNFNGDNIYVGWLHKVTRLSSMVALRASASEADVRLERKLHYEFAKFEAKGQLRSSFQSHYAPPDIHYSGALATDVARSSQNTAVTDPAILTILVGSKMGRKLSLTAMLKNNHVVWAILPKGFLVFP